MADIAFNWSDMEKDLSDSEYPRNYLHANDAEFSILKERNPDNIWIFRLEKKAYWLIGRLSVDLNLKKPEQATKNHWIRFDPNKSEIFIPAIEIPSSPNSVLRKISNQIFRNKGNNTNGQGYSAVKLIENPDVIQIKKIVETASRTNLQNVKPEQLRDTPFRYKSKQKKIKKSNIQSADGIHENLPLSSDISNSKQPLTDEEILIEELLNSPKISLSDDESRRDKQAENGALGERIAIKFEEARLRKESCPNPLEYIRHVAKENVGLGFDIYTSWGEARCIEVKTSQESSQNFFISANEVETLTKLKKHAWIYFIDLSCSDDIEKCVRTQNNPGEKFNNEIQLVATQYSAKW